MDIEHESFVFAGPYFMTPFVTCSYRGRFGDRFD